MRKLFKATILFTTAMVMTAGLSISGYADEMSGNSENIGTTR